MHVIITHTPTGIVRHTAWQRILVYIKPLTAADWIHRHGPMLLEVFYMLEVCCGSGASSRAMVTYMRRIGREGKKRYRTLEGAALDYIPGIAALLGRRLHRLL